VTSTLLTQIDDALTAAAIVIGGAFAYLKFIKGRVLTVAVGYEIRASVTAGQRRRRPAARRARPFHLRDLRPALRGRPPGRRLGALAQAARSAPSSNRTASSAYQHSASRRAPTPCKTS